MRIETLLGMVLIAAAGVAPARAEDVGRFSIVMNDWKIPKL